jgi:hypothetical protein
MHVECAPAFNYALAEHRTSLITDDTIPANGEHVPGRQKKALFESSDLTLDLRFVAESVIDGVSSPTVELRTLDLRPWGHKGISISSDLDLVEGQVVTFVLRTPPSTTTNQHISNPTNEQAQESGVSFDRELYRRYEPICCPTHHVAELLSGTTNPRNKADPLLTKVFLSLSVHTRTAHVSEEPSSRSSSRHQ